MARQAFENRSGAVEGFTARHSIKRLVYFEEHTTAEEAIQWRGIVSYTAVALIMAIVGVCFTVSGAWIASREIIVDEDQAIVLGVSRLAGTREENLQLPTVQALLRQSRAVQRGLILIFLGAGFQIVAVILAGRTQAVLR